jgi:ElaB/YqjD/DUF883 family membrane-anchored ribosome-binding protein
MAEVAGITLTVGIELCKGLKWYFDNFRNGEIRITQISEQMDRLASLLEAVESAVNGMCASEAQTQTKTIIQACSRALEEVRKKLGSTSVYANTNGSSKFGRQVRKLKDPFLQDGLLYCKGRVESVQQNLNTALIVLQM